MKMGNISLMKSVYSFIFSILLTGSYSAVMAQEQFPCVWRNPERTMKRIFSEAHDYRTVNRQISAADKAFIESALGEKLLSGQDKVFTYYEMIDNTGRLIGYIFAPSQKGEFGAIEFVFGLSSDMELKGLYIQRSRERDNRFKKQEFIGLFTGKGTDEILAKLYPIKQREYITYGERAVVSGVIKELTLVKHFLQK